MPVIAVLTAALIALAGPAPAGAAGATEATGAVGAEAGTTARTVDPHKAHFNVRFADPEMDFVFGSLILGAAPNGGCEIGEAFTAASKIKNGDADSWQAAWIEIAGLAEARGEKSLAAGHRISARDQFLRACYYYRAALVPTAGTDPKFKDVALRARSLMRRAGDLMSPKLEYVEIPFAGAAMPGYFRKAAQTDAPVKTLVMIGGAETFAEDQFFFIARQAFERGYNFLTADLPGQGLTPLEGRYFDADIGKAVSAAVTYALARKDVDASRIAVYGISSGGGFVPMAAASDNRIKAVVMNNCVVDAGTGVAKMAVATATPEIAATWSSFKRGTNQAIAWRFGLDPQDLPGLVKANMPLAFDPAKVAAPALILVAAGEYSNPEIKRQNDLCLACLANARKTMTVTPADEGAVNHCVMENRSLMSQTVFDWLDETFK